MLTSSMSSFAICALEFRYPRFLVSAGVHMGNANRILLLGILNPQA